MMSLDTGLIKKQFATDNHFSLQKPGSTKILSGLQEIGETLRVPHFFEVKADHAQYKFQHIIYKAGQCIHRNGQSFESLYIIHSGFLKTVHHDDMNNEQIVGFPMKGDVLGIDGIHTKVYASDAITLTICDVIVLPYKTLQDLFKKNIDFENMLFMVMSRDLARKQSHLCLLGSASSEERVAQFLVRMGQRFSEIGYSANVFELQMTRHEIGSYLGLTLETVSRTLAILHEIGLISVDRRSITINFLNKLSILRKIYPTHKEQRLAVAPDVETPAKNIKHIPARPDLQL